ncbi:MAG: MerR family transcriptional regulator [Neptuniibacter sp.]
MSEKYSIGEVAAAGNCQVQTIRYYEQIGLMPAPERTAGNQRIYRKAHYDRLAFIRHSRELGFSLEQIREILTLNDSPNHSCGDVDAIARNHLADVESKIKRLQGMKKELKRMIEQCAGGTVSDCRIIEVLSDHKLCLEKKHISG